MIKPLNNNCLIEVIDEYDGIVGSDAATSMQKGILKNLTLVPDHLTVATGFKIDDIETYDKAFTKMIDKTVYWQEYADAGSKFEIDGKQYVLVPWYRLIGWEA